MTYKFLELSKCYQFIELELFSNTYWSHIVLVCGRIIYAALLMTLLVQHPRRHLDSKDETVTEKSGIKNQELRKSLISYHYAIEASAY